MQILNKKEPILLFLGDIVCFLLSLWLALFTRAGIVPPTSDYLAHLIPFSYLFFVWICVFFIAGLYEKHTLAFRKKLPMVLLKVQIFNAVVAVLFFYLMPSFGIAPKTILFIYLIISSILILLWRLYGEHVFGIRERERAMLVATGIEMKELLDEVKNNFRYEIDFVSVIDTQAFSGAEIEQKLKDAITKENISTVVIDLHDELLEPLLPTLYGLVFKKVFFADMHKMYESIFDRVPLSLLEHRWFLENISLKHQGLYDVFKRIMDIGIAGILGIISLILYPFIALAIFIDDGKNIFITQERVGKDNKPIMVTKFRSMSISDDGLEVADKKLRITRVGSFIRKTRIDELPQLWNVVRGDLSLIGPRPELPKLANLYEASVPYYNVRHMIKPGLSGWAQIYHEQAPKFGVAVGETKEKLSYDLYYIKNRSLLLDFKIALKTLKTLFSRSGV
ncbi:MAG: exopolysaccharide biosynthesis polyprenyl glycosylphosphotransferase [Candidatus Paceibacterota bacterium]|jgi:exopolysaccharide biosynthesis polyprenyl glycosylphosphotransferase